MKKIALLIIAPFLLLACEKEFIDVSTIDQQNELLLKKAAKYDVCHWDKENNTWVAISIAKVAYEKAHEKHGDVLVVDADQDGYYVFNECGINNPDGVFDCNDDDPSIYPGAEEICDGLDNNCDGTIDENCLPDNEGTFIDPRDEHSYKWIRIGKQVWMAENLAFNTNDENSRSYNNDESYVATYGRLYNWGVAQQVCPEGWHLPTDAEWNELSATIHSGGKLKEAGLDHWFTPNAGATNESGFTALPGGAYLSTRGTYNYSTTYGYWWSADKYNDSNSWTYRLGYSNSILYRHTFDKLNCLSIRCIMNE